MYNPIVNSTYARIKNNLGIMQNRITTWQPQHQQHVSDTIIFSTSGECLHTLYLVNFLRTLTLKLHHKAMSHRRYDLNNLSLTNWLHLLNLLFSTI